jgi:hypothetical protein
VPRDFGGKTGALPALDERNGTRIRRDEPVGDRPAFGVDEISAAAIAGRRHGDDVRRVRSRLFKQRATGLARRLPHAVGVALGPALVGQKHDIGTALAGELVSPDVKQHDLGHGAASVDADQAFPHSSSSSPTHRLHPAHRPFGLIGSFLAG